MPLTAEQAGQYFEKIKALAEKLPEEAVLTWLSLNDKLGNDLHDVNTYNLMDAVELNRASRHWRFTMAALSLDINKPVIRELASAGWDMDNFREKPAGRQI